MKYVFSTATKILIAVISIITQLANMFWSNIIIYEITEGLRFDWNLLVKNLGFWIILGINLLYYTSALAIKQKTKSVDEAVEEAISRNSVKLINSIAKSAQSGDFESCKKTLKVLDQIQKRRRR